MATIDSVAERNNLAAKFGTDVLWAAMFIGDPGATGSVAGELSGGSPAYARKQVVWSSPSGGTITGVVTFDVPLNPTLQTYYAGLCTASTGANLVCRGTLGQQQFGTQGTFQLTVSFAV